MQVVGAQGAAGAGAPATIRFRTLPQRPAGLEATASMLIERQCNAQLDLLPRSCVAVAGSVGAASSCTTCLP